MAKGNILLSEKHGVNPHLTYCPRCGKEGQELILTGAAKLYECACGQKHIGYPKNGRCVKCELHRDLVCKGEIPPETKLSGSLCDSCDAEVKRLKAEVDRGGIPFRCVDCKVEGVIKAEHELAKTVRKERGLCGIEFSKKDCPQCSDKEG